MNKEIRRGREKIDRRKVHIEKKNMTDNLKERSKLMKVKQKQSK